MKWMACFLAVLFWMRVAECSAITEEDKVYLARLAETGENGRDHYDPLENVVGDRASRALPTAHRPVFDSGVLAEAKRYALANNSKALLIWREGRLQQVVYAANIDHTTLLNSRSMAKPLGAIAVGRAIELGKIRSLDQSAADFIGEWRATAKRGITLRQILNMTAGLAEQGPVKDPASIWSRSYLHPRHDDIIVNEYPLTAEPGTRYQYSNADADLVALIIERATGRRYAEFVSADILQPLGATGGKVWVDRPGGLAHSGCCVLLPAETWLRLGLLLMGDGHWHGRRLLPAGYVAQMRTPSADNPRYGLGVWIEGDYVERRGFGRPGQTAGGVWHSEPYLAHDLFMFDGNADQVLYIIPSRQLAILRMGETPPKEPEWDNAYLPNLLLRAQATAAKVSNRRRHE